VLRNSYTLLGMGSGMWVLSCFTLIRQRPVSKSRGLLRIGDFWELQTVNEASLKVTTYPLSHNCPTCALDAAAFNSGIFNSAVREDSMIAPLGRRTVKGVKDMTSFKHGALTNRKWPVHPESTIARSCGLRSGGVRQPSNIELLFRCVAPEYHSLLA
jgi:hypothetical protein